jgi:uncharacterized protein (TIGR03435 family)
MNQIRMLIVMAALAGSTFGQAFEVASVREADPALVRIRGTIEPNPGSLIIRNTTLRDAIRWAYDQDGARIGVMGGPQWADSARYDIVAKPPTASSNNQLRVMLRTLLADRFKLVVRAERIDNAVYALIIDPKGHTLRPSKTEGPLSRQRDTTGIAFRNTTMSDLQRFLLTVPGLDRPVINRTGVDGAFDFKLAILDVAPTEKAGNEAIVANGILPYADALAPLGLKLDPQNVPLDVITIEKVERPAEN